MSCRPRLENCNGHTSDGVPLSLTGSMWLTVVIRENDHFWRQTDDERSGCVHTPGKVRSGLYDCGHYELCGYTDESSATRTFATVCCFENGTHTVKLLSSLLKDLHGFVGLAENNPTLFT